MVFNHDNAPDDADDGAPDDAPDDVEVVTYSYVEKIVEVDLIMVFNHIILNTARSDAIYAVVDLNSN